MASDESFSDARSQGLNVCHRAQQWRRALRCAAVLALGAVWFAAACGGHPASLAAPPSVVTAAASRSAASATASNAKPAPAFAAGACQTLQPTHGNQHRTIFVDAGHGGPDPGTSGRTQQGAVIEEKMVTLAVALDLAPLLRAQGDTVVLSRTRDSSVVRLGAGDLVRGVYTNPGDHRDLLARVACANATKANLLLSIHFNGYGDPRVGGTETFYDAARPFSAENLRFAQLVQHEVQAALTAAGWQIPDRGIAVDSSDNAPTHTAQAAAYPYLLELGPAQSGWLDAPSTMPGALCEPLFLSDPIEASIAASSAGQHALARGFADAIQAYFAGNAASAVQP